MPGQTLYTKLTANQILPEVREHLSSLQQSYREVERHRAAVSLRSHTNGGDPKGSAWATYSEQVEHEMEWFDQRSITIKDIEQGLIDFPGMIDGQQVLLCWKDGEPEVAFWHTYQAGFAGRKPL